MANEYYIDLDRLTLYDTQLKTYDSTDVKMNGTAAVGTSKRAARADHIHPTDTSRAPLASPTFTGTPKAPTAAAGTNTTQIATTAFVKAAVDASGGEPNQNAFSHVNVVTQTDPPIDVALDAASETDRFTISPGSNVQLSANTTTKTITVSATDTKNLASMTGTLGVGHGGTGATTLTGIVKGNGTSAMSAAAASDVVSLLGTTAVNRAAADAAGNNIASTYLTQTDAASTYALKTDISGIYKYKGSVATAANLPASPSTGDVYNIEAESTYGPAGTNVAWTGSVWDSLGGIFSISTATNAQIEALFS